MLADFFKLHLMGPILKSEACSHFPSHPTAIQLVVAGPFLLAHAALQVRLTFDFCFILTYN